MGVQLLLSIISTDTLHISIRTLMQSIYPLLEAQCKAFMKEMIF